MKYVNSNNVTLADINCRTVTVSSARRAQQRISSVKSLGSSSSWTKRARAWSSSLSCDNYSK